MKITVDQIIELAQEVEIEDPIDWGMLSIDEQEAYRLIALGVIDMFNDELQSEDRYLTMLSVIVKLSVENFVLNLKLLQR